MRRTFDICFYYAFPLLALLTLAMNCWKAFHGIIMHDDAWYLYLLRDLPPLGGALKYQYLFHNVWGGNIAAVKLTGTLMDLVASLVFAFGLWRYFCKQYNLNRKHYVALASLTYLAQSCFTILITSISYVTLNRFVALLSLGLIFIALTIPQKSAKALLYLLSGWFVGFLLFIMITNMPFVGVLLIFIPLMEQQRGNRWIGFFSFGIGVLLSWATYFLTAEPLDVFVANLLTTTDKAMHGGIDPSHSLSMVALWVYQSVAKFYILEVVLYACAIIGIEQLVKRYAKTHGKERKYWWVIAALFLLLFVEFWKYCIWRKGYSVASVTPFYALLAIFVFRNVLHLQWRDTLLFALLFFTPFFLSMGTDQSLAFRSHEYMCFLLPCLFLLIISANTPPEWKMTFFALVLCYWLTTTLKISKGNWGWLVYTEQKNDVRELGLSQYLYVSDNVYNDLKAMQEVIKPEDRTAVSNNLSFGYMYLLDTKPLTWDLRQLDLYEKLPDLNGAELKMIENQWYPYRETFLDSIRVALGKDTIVSAPYPDGKIIWFE